MKYSTMLRAAAGVELNYDPYWDNVVLAMHMDGADNGTVFTDLKGHTVTRYGNTVTKTSQKKFGTASAYFDGSGDYLGSADSTDWDFGSDPGTIEAWVFLSGNSSPDSLGSRYASIVNNRSTSDSSSFAFYIAGDATSTGIGLSLQSQYSGTDQTRGVLAPITQLEWHHLAVSFDTTGVYFAVDGYILKAPAFTLPVIGGSSFRIGNLNVVGFERPLNGYIDDLRITKGVARYKRNFVPPRRPFPDS